MANRRKDVYPQFMSFSTTMSATDTTTSERVQMPIARRPGAKKVTVIEVLSVSIDIAGDTFAAGDISTVLLSFRDPGEVAVPTFSDPNVWFFYNSNTVVTTSGLAFVQMPWKNRYDTGGGKGFLIATDSIFTQVSSASQAGPLTAHFKVLYRFVEVGLQEYIGIIQQQSSQT